MKRIVGHSLWAISAIGAAFVIVGCMSNYAPPEGNDIAEVDLVNSVTTPLIAFVYKGAAECTDRSAIKGGVEPGAHTVLTVDASKEFATTLISVDGIHHCRINLSFQPERGHKYRLAYTGAVADCHADLTEADNGQTREVSYVTRLSKMGFDESGPWCGPKP